MWRESSNVRVRRSENRGQEWSRFFVWSLGEAMGQVITTTYLNQQMGRAWAVLPAGGVWDIVPTECQCSDFTNVALYCNYQRGAAGGAVDFRIEVSPDLTGTAWHRLTVQALGIVVPGADIESDVQAQDFSFEPLTGNREYFVYGPIDLGGTVERIRVAAQETGNVANPGSCEIELRFGA